MIYLILFICALPTVHPIDYRIWDNSWNVQERLLKIMKNYNDRAKVKVVTVTNIRSKYEISPHFEAGYVVSEILESYRKMVGLIQHHYDYPIDSLFDVMKTTELVQKLFLEIYHLVNMFHEIARKYSHMPEFQDQEEVNTEALENAMKQILENAKLREKERKRKLKELKKQREMYMKGEILKTSTTTKKPANKWWPIDYGWEIDYKW